MVELASSDIYSGMFQT